MGQKITIPITNGFYLSESLPISAQECVNWYINFPQVPALTEVNLFGTPGLVERANTGSFVENANRGALVKGDIPYFVNGSALYRLNDDFSITVLGTVAGSGRVSLAENGTQLCILVPGGPGYIYNEDDGTPFQEITDPDFRANGEPQYVVFKDGYFVFTTDQKKFIISALNDGLSYNALDFGSAEADPDRIVAPLVHDNTLYIFGSETFEAFQNIGGSGFPFQRIQGSVISKGLFAPFSAIESNTAFYWIGGSVTESPAIWVSNGGEPAKISTTAIDNALDRFSEDEIANAYAVAYGQKGAYFVAFSVGDTTFVYDIFSSRAAGFGVWHERRSVVGEGLRTWRVASLVKAYGITLVGDVQSGNIGELDRDTYTEYGVPIFRRCSTQPLTNQSDSFSIPSLELTVESGVGNDAVPDPKIRMDWSKDGKVFRDDRTRTLGKKGEFGRRAIWRKLGRFPRFAVFRWTLTDAVTPNLLRLEVEVS